jgi:tryptophanyl-tRNA synthetase
MPPRWPSLRRPRSWNQHYSRRSYAMTTPEKKIVFSGIQPTGTPHLGNYLGALKNWVSLQHTFPPDSDIFYCIVDMHAITIPYNPSTLRNHTHEMWCVLHAVGIDMQRCTVFEQSAVSSCLSNLIIDS